MAVILVYDVNDKTSFEYLKEQFEEGLVARHREIFFTLFAVKHLDESERVISSEDGLKLSQEYGIHFAEKLLLNFYYLKVYLTWIIAYCSSNN